jgi:sugar lactone lactonase YvrE
MVLDKYGHIWVACDGGNEWSYLPEGVTMEAPSLWRIPTKNYLRTKVFDFKAGGWFSSRLAINGAGDTIYFIYDERCWAIDIATDKLPTKPFITIEDYGLYGIGVDPVSEDIYIANAKDYVSNGEVLRYSPEGELIDTFEVGISPSSFAFFSE